MGTVAIYRLRSWVSDGLCNFPQITGWLTTQVAARKSSELSKQVSQNQWSQVYECLLTRASLKLPVHLWGQTSNPLDSWSGDRCVTSRRNYGMIGVEVAGAGKRWKKRVQRTLCSGKEYQNINIQGHFASKNSPNPYSHHFRKTTNKTIKTWKQISIFCLRVSFIKMSLPMAIVFSQVSGTGRFLLSEKNWLSFSGVWPCPMVTPHDRGQEPAEWRRWWWRTPPVQGRLLGGWREEVLWPPGVILCFSPQGRAAEPSAPL